MEREDEQGGVILEGEEFEGCNCQYFGASGGNFNEWDRTRCIVEWMDIVLLGEPLHEGPLESR